MNKYVYVNGFVRDRTVKWKYIVDLKFQYRNVGIYVLIYCSVKNQYLKIVVFLTTGGVNIQLIYDNKNKYILKMKTYYF